MFFSCFNNRLNSVFSYFYLGSIDVIGLGLFEFLIKQVLCQKKVFLKLVRLEVPLKRYGKISIFSWKACIEKGFRLFCGRMLAVLLLP